MADLDPALVRAEAERKVQAALRLIERAQVALEHACQELSPVVGAVSDWQRIGKLRDRVNAEWHRLHEVRPRGGYSLDEDGQRALAKRLAGEDRHA